MPLCFVDIIIQKDYHAELSERHAIKFIVFIMYVGVFVAVVCLILV